MNQKFREMVSWFEEMASQLQLTFLNFLFAFLQAMKRTLNRLLPNFVGKTKKALKNICKYFLLSLLTRRYYNISQLRGSRERHFLIDF